MQQVKLSTPSQAIANLLAQENPDATITQSGNRINLSSNNFSIKTTEIIKTLGLDTIQSTEEIWAIISPQLEAHSRVVVSTDNTHITIAPAKTPTQVRLRTDTSAILTDICKVSGLKKVDVLHQAIRDFHLRLNTHE
jgi:hypothetical protein